MNCLYKKAAYVLNIIGYIISMFLINMILMLVLGYCCSGTITANISVSDNFFATVISFLIPMLVSFVIVPIIIIRKTKKIQISDIGLTPCFSCRGIIAKILFLVATISVMIYSCCHYKFDYALHVIIIYIVVGLSEEIIARGIIYRLLNEKLSEFSSIILSALIFAFIFHSGQSGVTNLFIRFPMGIIFSFLYLYSGDLYSSIMFHTLYDIIVTLIL